MSRGSLDPTSTLVITPLAISYSSVWSNKKVSPLAWAANVAVKFPSQPVAVSEDL